MIKLITFAAFAWAVVTSAEAMSPAPLPEADDMITQVRGLVAWPRAKCWNVNQRYINGVCVFNARPVSPAEHVCVAWWDGVCTEHYGTLKGWRPKGAERLP